MDDAGEDDGDAADVDDDDDDDDVERAMKMKIITMTTMTLTMKMMTVTLLMNNDHVGDQYDVDDGPGDWNCIETFHSMMATVMNWR